MLAPTPGLLTCRSLTVCRSAVQHANGHHWLFRRRNGHQRDLLRICGIPESLSEKEVVEAIERVANLILRTFPKAFVHGEGPVLIQHIWVKLLQGKFRARQTGDPQAQFLAWCRKVGHRKCLTLYKKWKRRLGTGEATDPSEIYANTPPVPRVDAFDALRNHCRLVRRELDRLEREYASFDVRQHRQRSQVDYFAVLLMRVRLDIARLLAPFLQQQEAGQDETVVPNVEELMPWHHHENWKSFRKGMPCLADIWDSLGERLGASPYSLDGQEFWEHLAAMPNAGVDVSQKNQWDNWTRRVCRNLLDSIRQGFKPYEASVDELKYEWQKSWGMFFGFPGSKSSGELNAKNES